MSWPDAFRDYWLRLGGRVHVLGGGAMTAAELRDIIRKYGARLTEAEYEVLYEFGIWYAGQNDAMDVVLSDWTPL